MTEIAETVTCDGTCGLSPADCANLHPDPMTALRAQIGEAIATWAGARMTICEHTQLIEYGAAAEAVLATIEAHPALTIRHYAPTQDAYDAACKALEKHRARADEAEAEAERLTARMEVLAERYKATSRIHNLDQASETCTTCRTAYPCRTLRVLDGG